MDWFFSKIEKEGVSIYKFSKETSIPKERIIKWKQKKGKPKVDDMVTISQYFKNNGWELPHNVEDSVISYPANVVPPLQTDQTRQILAMDIPAEAKIDLLVELVALKEGEYALLEKITAALKDKIEQLKSSQLV